MTRTRRSWSFRARLTALIAAVFVAGGTALLVVQYLLVHGLFEDAIGSITSCVDERGVTVVAGADSELDCQTISHGWGTDPDTATASDDDYAVIVEQTTLISEDVLSGLLLWSIVTLLVFTGVAVAVASWLSRRSFARIGQITTTTQQITRNDLHQRLDLPGPADEIKELGDTIDTMLDRLQTSFTQQERFITNASHELRTPLTTTRTSLEIPLEQGEVPQHLEPAVRRALEANRRSENLIAALLQLARAARAELTSPVERGTALRPLIEESLTERQQDIEDRHLTVTTELGRTSTTTADEALLRLAIENLIDNAIQHNDDHGTVHIVMGESDGQVWIEVANDGPSLSNEEAAQLVEPFNRGPHTRTAAGGRSLGLGLTLVQNIAESIGATLTLTPGPDGGLVARLSCPQAT